MNKAIPQPQPKDLHGAGRRTRENQCPKCLKLYDTLEKHLQLCGNCLWSAENGCYVEDPLVPNEN